MKERKQTKAKTAEKAEREMRDALLQVRSQALMTACMREKIGEQTPDALHALRIDGMPRGSAGRCGLDSEMIRREEAARILREEEARLRRMEKKARTMIARTKPEIYAFCALYYIGGMSMTQTAEALSRSERQCARYRREIEGEEDEG